MHKPLYALAAVLAARLPAAVISPGRQRPIKKSPGEPGLQVRYLSDF